MGPGVQQAARPRPRPEWPGRSDGPGTGRDQPGEIRPLSVPFRRSDAALLLPFASLLGLHVRASQRYLHIKDLLVGLTRSLTAAIDAKDAYTYGHSERVARAAVELGRELGLPEDELSDIYLAGLLHDIGKIGIRDDVLTKRGPLTPTSSSTSSSTWSSATASWPTSTRSPTCSRASSTTTSATTAAAIPKA